MPIRSTIAKSLPFRDMNCGEDTAWAEEICKLVRTEHRIDKILYVYQFDSKTTEAQSSPRADRLA
jgi:hypothetical protein